MSREYDRYVPIFELLGRGEDSGKLYRLDAVKISYKYKMFYDDLTSIWIFGIKPGETRARLLTGNNILPVTESPTVEGAMVFELRDKTLVSDFWMIIKHNESLEDLYDIQCVYEVYEIGPGVEATAEAISCE